MLPEDLLISETCLPEESASHHYGFLFFVVLFFMLLGNSLLQRERGCEALSSHGARHSPPWLGVGWPDGGIRGGHWDCCKNLTFRRFSTIQQIAREKITAAPNVLKFHDSIYVFDSL